MKGLSAKWQKLIVWLTGYANIIAFVIAGGYLFKNTQYEEVKRSAKISFLVTAIFTAIEALWLFMQYCVCLAGTSTTWINKTNWVIQLIQVVVFAVLLIVDLTVGLGSAKNESNTETTEENEDNV
ncbi:MAG: hypothetical protein ACI4VK_05305 [Candidatus Coproplasma sp.]